MCSKSKYQWCCTLGFAPQLSAYVYMCVCVTSPTTAVNVFQTSFQCWFVCHVLWRAPAPGWHGPAGPRCQRGWHDSTHRWWPQVQPCPQALMQVLPQRRVSFWDSSICCWKFCTSQTLLSVCSFCLCCAVFHKYCFLCVKLNEVLTFEHCDNTEPLKIYGLVGCFDQRKTVYRNAIKPIQEHHYCIVPLCWRESVSSPVIIQDFVYFTSAQCILHELSPRRSRCQRSASIYVATASKVSSKPQTNEKPRSHDKCS